MSAGDGCNCSCHTMSPVHCERCLGSASLTWTDVYDSATRSGLVAEIRTLRAEVERLRGLKEASDRGIQRLKDSAALRTSEWEKRFRVIVGEDSPDAAGNAVIALKARAEKAERERDETERLRKSWEAECIEEKAYRDAAEARAEKAKREVEELNKGVRRLVNERDSARAAREWLQNASDAAEARADKLAAALREAMKELRSLANATRLRGESERDFVDRVRTAAALAADRIRALADGEKP